MSRSHSYSVDIASSFGIEVAVLLNHFSFWYLKNASDSINFKKGDYWVRMKIRTLREYYPYFSERQLRYLIDKMVDLKLIKQDEFNDKKNDRTKWYSLTILSKKILNISTDKNVSNFKNNASKSVENPTDKNVINVSDKIVSLTDKNVTSNNKEVDIEYRYVVIKEKLEKNIGLQEQIAMRNKLKRTTVKKSIYDFILRINSIKQFYNNDTEIYSHFANWVGSQNLTDIDLEKELQWFIKIFNKISKRDFKITDSVRKSFSNQFYVGYSSDDFKKAIVNLYNSSPENKFHIQSSFKFATPEYLLKGDNMNKYLNFKI